MLDQATPNRWARLLAATLLACAAGAVALTLAGSANATVWLCKPGKKPDPCTPGLSTTVYDAPLNKAVGVQHPPRSSVRGVMPRGGS
jgi:hypothetical protein